MDIQNRFISFYEQVTFSTFQALLFYAKKKGFIITENSKTLFEEYKFKGRGRNVLCFIEGVVFVCLSSFAVKRGVCFSEEEAPLLIGEAEEFTRQYAGNKGLSPRVKPSHHLTGHHLRRPFLVDVDALDAEYLKRARAGLHTSMEVSARDLRRAEKQFQNDINRVKEISTRLDKKKDAPSPIPEEKGKQKIIGIEKTVPIEVEDEVLIKIKIK
jgi:hypothetical protein